MEGKKHVTLWKGSLARYAEPLIRWFAGS